MDTLLQVGGWALLAISAFGLVAAVRVLRREAPVRPKFDGLRLLIALGAAALITVVLSVGTPPALIGLAVVAGGLFGLVQGRALKIRFVNDVPMATRSVVSIIVWGLGMIAAQAGGLLGRTGAADVGLAVSYFSAAGIAGGIVGRSQTLTTARKAVAPAALVGFMALVALSTGPQTRADARGGVEDATREVVMSAPFTGAFLPEVGVEGSPFAISTVDGTFRASFTLDTSGGEARVSGFSGTVDWGWIISGEGISLTGGMNSSVDPPTVTDAGDSLHFEGTGAGTYSYPEFPGASGPISTVWQLDWVKATGAFTGTVTIGAPDEGISEAVGGEFGGSTDPILVTTTTQEGEEEAAAAARETGEVATEASEDEIPVEQAAGASVVGLVGVAALLGVSLAEAGMSMGDAGRAALGRTPDAGAAAAYSPAEPPAFPSDGAVPTDGAGALGEPLGAPPGASVAAEAARAAEQSAPVAGGIEAAARSAADLPSDAGSVTGARLSADDLGPRTGTGAGPGAIDSLAGGAAEAARAAEQSAPVAGAIEEAARSAADLPGDTGAGIEEAARSAADLPSDTGSVTGAGLTAADLGPRTGTGAGAVDSLAGGAAEAARAAEQSAPVAGGIEAAARSAADLPADTVELGEIDTIVASGSGAPEAGAGQVTDAGGTSELVGDVAEDTAELAADAVEERARLLASGTGPGPSPEGAPPPPTGEDDDASDAADEGSGR